MDVFEAAYSLLIVCVWKYMRDGFWMRLVVVAHLLVSRLLKSMSKTIEGCDG